MKNSIQRLCGHVFIVPEVFPVLLFSCIKLYGAGEDGYRFQTNGAIGKEKRTGRFLLNEEPDMHLGHCRLEARRGFPEAVAKIKRPFSGNRYMC